MKLNVAGSKMRSMGGRGMSATRILKFQGNGLELDLGYKTLQEITLITESLLKVTRYVDAGQIGKKKDIS